MRFHLIRLALYLGVVVGVWLLGWSHEPAPVFGLVCAAGVAVVGAPALLLSLQGIDRGFHRLPVRRRKAPPSTRVGERRGSTA